MSRKPPSEQILANTTAVFKFYGEGWSTGVLENFPEPKTITEPTDSYMITEVSADLKRVPIQCLNMVSRLMAGFFPPLLLDTSSKSKLWIYCNFGNAVRAYNIKRD